MTPLVSCRGCDKFDKCEWPCESVLAMLDKAEGVRRKRIDTIRVAKLSQSDWFKWNNFIYAGNYGD